MFQKRFCLMLMCVAFTGFSLVSFGMNKRGPYEFESLYVDLIAYTDKQWDAGYSLNTSKTPFENGSQYPAILNKQPAFSWSIKSGNRPFGQHAFRILVADRPDVFAKSKTYIWDSGKVKSNRSAGIVMKDAFLRAGQTYYWKVVVWDEKGVKTESDIAVFYTGDIQEGYQTSRYPLQRSDQHPHNIEKDDDGSYFMDFGKAAFSQLSFDLTSTSDKDTLTVHLGEALDKKGRVNRSPGGTIRYQVYRLPLKKGTHTYQVEIKSDARNTGPQAVLMPAYIGEVLPFRYVTVEGYKGELKKEQVLRSMVHYHFDDDASYFHSSNDTLNQIWELCKYSLKATTFAGVYVDGDRERIPYEADAYINQLCHYAADQEYTLARHSHEYLMHHATWPTEWILQSVLMAYNDYLYTGDLRSAAHYYNDLKAKTLTMLEESNGLISSRKGKQNPELLKSIYFNGKELRDIVDWPHGGILGLSAKDMGESDGFVFTDFNAVVNAYYYKALIDMHKLAEALGKVDDSQYYKAKATNVYRAFQQHFFREDVGNYQDGIETDHASLHSNMFALAFDLVPDKYKSTVMDYVKSRGLACSVYGSQFLMDAIYQSRDADYGLSLLTSTAERSWYNMIREGSTITMEAWGNKFKPNQDWNHVWGAVPGNIIPRKLMGVEPTLPAWEHFHVRPQISNLSAAKIKVPTIKGPVLVDITQNAQSFSMSVEVPANTTADIYIPIMSKKNRVTVFVDNKAQELPVYDSWAKLEGVRAGQYHLTLNKLQ